MADRLHASSDLSRRELLAIGAAVAVASCGAEIDTATRQEGDLDASSPDASLPDAVSHDTGVHDTGVHDTGVHDTGVHDTGVHDTGVYDTGVHDTGVYDTGVHDTGVHDSGSPDAGMVDVPTRDTGPVDTGPVDTGRIDTGPVDTGPPCPPPGATMLGALSSFPMGRWASVTAQRVIVGRDSRGIFAYSSVCTHRGCAVPAPASSMVNSRCPCHGALFTADGAVVGGPTTTPLVNYPVTVCGGNVYYRRTTTVPAGTRTPVP